MTDLTDYACQSHQLSCKVLRDEIERLRARVAELEADALRFDWYFGPADKQEFLLRYLEGVRAGWSVDQWRAEIDAVRLPFMKETSR